MQLTKEALEQNIIENVTNELVLNVKEFLRAQSVVDEITPVSDKMRDETLQTIKPKYYGLCSEGKVIEDIGELKGKTITKWSDVCYANKETKNEIFKLYDDKMKHLGIGNKKGVCFRLQCESLLLSFGEHLINALEKVTGVKRENLVLSEQREKYLDICVKAIVLLYPHQFKD